MVCEVWSYRISNDDGHAWLSTLWGNFFATAGGEMKIWGEAKSRQARVTRELQALPGCMIVNVRCPAGRQEGDGRGDGWWEGRKEHCDKASSPACSKCPAAVDGLGPRERER